MARSSEYAVGWRARIRRARLAAQFAVLLHVALGALAAAGAAAHSTDDLSLSSHEYAIEDRSHIAESSSSLLFAEGAAEAAHGARNGSTALALEPKNKDALFKAVRMRFTQVGLNDRPEYASQRLTEACNEVIVDFIKSSVGDKEFSHDGCHLRLDISRAQAQCTVPPLAFTVLGGAVQYTGEIVVTATMPAHADCWIIISESGNVRIRLDIHLTQQFAVTGTGDSTAVVAPVQHIDCDGSSIEAEFYFPFHDHFENLIRDKFDASCRSQGPQTFANGVQNVMTPLVRGDTPISPLVDFPAVHAWYAFGNMEVAAGKHVDFTFSAGIAVVRPELTNALWYPPPPSLTDYPPLYALDDVNATYQHALMADMRSSVALGNGLLWALGLDNAFNGNTVNSTVVDALLLISTNFTSPNMTVTSENEMRAYMAYAHTQAVCGPGMPEANNTLLDVTVRDVHCAGEPLVVEPNNLTLHISECVFQPTSLNIAFPRIPLPQPFVDAVITSSINRNMDHINKLLQLEPFRIPDSLAIIMPEPFASASTGSGGYVEIFQPCSCPPAGSAQPGGYSPQTLSPERPVSPGHVPRQAMWRCKSC